MRNPVEIVELQSQVIALQSEAINELFQILMQYMTVEDLERLPCVERINRATMLPQDAAPRGR